MGSMDLTLEIADMLAIDETLANLGGDHELLKELVDFFLQIMPGQLDDLEAVVAAGDVAGVDLQAHSIKGGAANVGAVRLAAAARTLEMRAKAGSLEGAADLVADLRREFAALQSAAPRIDWQALR